MSGTATSVVQINVDDAAFQRFKTLFDNYSNALNQTNAAWTITNATMQGAANAAAQVLDPATATALAAAETSKSHEKIVSLLAMQTAVMRQVGDEQARLLENLDKVFQRHQAITTPLRQQSTLWNSLVDSTKSVATHIADATRDLLKWSTIGSAVSGLLGLGGLFGLEHLAGTAGSARRAALGLGLGGPNGIGEMRAFNSDFARFIDPQAMLPGVQAAIQDPTKRLPLSMLGINPGLNADPAQVAAQVLQRLPEYLRKQQAAGIPLGTLFQMGHFGDLGLSMQDLARLAQISPQEMQRQQGLFGQDTAKLNIPENVAKQWQDFTNRLSVAGQSIQTVLITGLVRLSKPILDVSAALERLVETAMKAPAVQHFIDVLGHGADWLADRLNKITPGDVDKFMNTLKDVSAQVFDFGQHVLHAIEWINNALKPLDDPGSQLHKLLTDPLYPFDDPEFMQRLQKLLGAPQPGQGDIPGGAGTPGFDPNGAPLQKQGFFGPTPGWTSMIHPAAYRQVEQAEQLPPGVLAALVRQESGGNPNALSPSGAIGLTQLLPGTARGLGVNPYDPTQNLWGGAEYLSEQLKNFGGNLEEALAAYNAGPQNVVKALAEAARQHAQNWMQFLPKPQETIPYVAAIMRSLGMASGGIPRHAPRSGVHVVVSNNTGGNASVSYGQLSASEWGA